jgi:hypothetical protein
VKHVFKHDPANRYPWNAYDAAVVFAHGLGYSVGAMQAGSPTAVFKGDCDVSKWRNLDAIDRKEMDGTITAPRNRFRESDVTLTIKD